MSQLKKQFLNESENYAKLTVKAQITIAKMETMKLWDKIDELEEKGFGSYGAVLQYSKSYVKIYISEDIEQEDESAYIEEKIGIFKEVFPDMVVKSKRYNEDNGHIVLDILLWSDDNLEIKGSISVLCQGELIEEEIEEHVETKIVKKYICKDKVFLNNEGVESEE